jgi:hypothetical protein
LEPDAVLTLLGKGYSQLEWEQIARLVVPGFRASISAERFARFIDGQFLNAPDSARDRFLFRDLNPRRPHLLMNATILSANRGGLGNENSGDCKGETSYRGYLRRRNPDEFFHFTYSDFYFGLLHSSIDDFPVAGAVAASAAFPVLVDPATLRDYCGASNDDVVTLMDGGVNDNQAMIEIYMILTELVLRQHRSDLSDLETLGPDDTAFVFIVNSSVTDSTGLSGDGVNGPPRSSIEYLSSLAKKVSRSVDVYSGVNYNLRKELYLDQIKEISASRKYARIEPKEISLTGLDQYRQGGLQAALWKKSGISAEPTDADGAINPDAATDPDAARIRDRRMLQGKVYGELVQNPGKRHDLHLSHWHPQCYYDIRERLDASLAHVELPEQDCLRQAARWSVALKAQELCLEAQSGPAHRAPDGLNCVNGVITIAHDDSAILGTPHVINTPDAKKRSCDMILEEITKTPKVHPTNAAKANQDDPEDLCRDLDRPVQSVAAIVPPLAR